MADPKDQLDRDPQDHQFGKAVAEDQELADELEDDGATDDDLATRITALNRDQRLVVAARTGKDPIRIVSSMGVSP